MLSINELPAAIHRFGFRGAVVLLGSRKKLRSLLPAWTTSLPLTGYRAPIHFRHGTTDKYVIADVLLRDQYRSVISLADVRVVVDAGANIGAASLYFLNTFADARVIAVEPDPGNFAVLAKNLSYYGPRATALQRALWWRAEPLELQHGAFRDGGEWSTQVKVAATSDATVEAITIDGLLAEQHVSSIDVLKIDIEGAERELFRDGRAAGWLSRVKTIAIELHDEESKAAFNEATAPVPATVTRDGEVTFWQKTL